MKDLNHDTFDVTPDPDVPKGVAIITDGGEPVYIGPIRGAPATAGCHMYLNPVDFKRLNDTVMKRRTIN